MKLNLIRFAPLALFIASSFAHAGLEYTNQNSKELKGLAGANSIPETAPLKIDRMEPVGRKVNPVPQAMQKQPKVETILLRSQSAASRDYASAAPVTGAAAEDWKGTAPAHNWSLGGMMGLGQASSYGGFAVVGTAAYLVAKDGWLADVNDRVYFETQAGPMFTSGSSLFKYGLLLRWDFQKDDAWTFYALGGLGGDISGSKLGSLFNLYPRFGIGTLWDIKAPFLIRAELSHELITVGLNFLL